MNSILTDRGQVTLPKNRDALGLTPGNSVEFDIDGQGRAVMRKADETAGKSIQQPDRFDWVRGRATVPWLTDELMRLLRGDE